MGLTRRRFLVGIGGFTAAAALGCGSSTTSPPVPVEPGPDGGGEVPDGGGGIPDGGAAPPDAGESPPDAGEPDAAPAQLTGRVVRPGDPGYDDARAAWNGRIHAAPRAIVFAATTADVQNAIAWAKENRVALRPRSGRHSYEGYSLVDDGLVLDVSAMNDVTVSGGTARIGAGATLGSLYDRLAASGVTVPGGSCATLGIAGLVLGGGLGLLGRKHGLLCDRLTAVEIVTADGQLRRASAGENADLFWALRGGGGGNFGVATAFELATVPAADVAIYSITWPIDDLAAVVAAWQSFAPSADPNLASVLGLSVRHVTALGQYVGTAADLMRLLAPLLAAGSPSTPDIQAMSYIDATHHFGDDTPDQHPKFKNSSAYLPGPLPDAAIAALRDRLASAPGPTNAIQLDAMGGAIAQVAPGDTAFVHRQAMASVQIEATWSDDADEAANRAWVQSVRDALAPYASGAYVNYIDADIADYATAYYGENLMRLAAVKRAYDPDGFFSFPQAIPT